MMKTPNDFRVPIPAKPPEVKVLEAKDIAWASYDREEHEAIIKKLQEEVSSLKAEVAALRSQHDSQENSND